jgi:protein subunit release factor A
MASRVRDRCCLGQFGTDARGAHRLVSLSRVIEPDEIKIDVFRSQSADGPVERVVRVTHISSGIVAMSSGKNSEIEDRDAAIAEIEEQLGRQAS